jgi:hypothetical protein
VFIVLTSTQTVKARKALAKLEGLPVRGVTYGGPDRTDPLIPGPGWTIEAVDTDCDDGAQAGIDLPQKLEKWLGQTIVVNGQSVTLPTVGQLVDPTALPASLKAIRAAKQAAIP